MSRSANILKLIGITSLTPSVNSKLAKENKDNTLAGQDENANSQQQDEKAKSLQQPTAKILGVSAQLFDDKRIPCLETDVLSENKLSSLCSYQTPQKYIEENDKPNDQFLHDQIPSDVSSYVSDSDELDELDDSDADPDFILEDSDNDDNNLDTEISKIVDIPLIKRDEQSTKVDKKINKLYQKDKENKRIRQRDHCFFCETFVLIFARHIERNHIEEIEVQRCLSKPKGSKERKYLLTLLRKKGNHLNSENAKPMKKPNLPLGEPLPCVHCLGYYAKKQLTRHVKKCAANPQVSESRSYLSEAQNLLIQHIPVDKQLKETVFPRMIADNISLVAKKDTIICAYGSRYIKMHREKHHVNVASRKMRDLAKLLIECQKIEPKIRSIIEALNPKYYDIIVEATKRAGKFNLDNQYFESPAYAINLGTTLKSCCDIAILYAIKRKNVFDSLSAAEAEIALKTMGELIKSNWRFDISSQACNDLNTQKWNKVTMVPLAGDLKIINSYLINQATECVAALEFNEKNREAYIKLTEIIYCRILLLNRKRPGELQRLPLYVYEQLSTQNNNYEEFEDAISTTEKILMKRFKRIVIRGKRGRGVPVLISADVQSHIDILLKCRNNFVPKSNTYLFAKPNLNTPIYGYKVMKKHASLSGVKHPEAITATKLRKHLATITQIFNLDASEVEQLSTFMGHTSGIHLKAYRLPDDVYQTAKISKLLLLMEKGTVAQYKGKSLEEIEIDLEDNLNDYVNDDSEKEEEIIHSERAEETTAKNMESADTAGNSNGTTCSTANQTNKKRILLPWTYEQKKTTISFFKEHIKKCKPPRKQECEDLIKKNPDLFNNRTWLKIKVFVQNQYLKKLKQV